MTGNKVKLNIVGLDGNAFSILGAFQRKAAQQGWEEEDIKKVVDEATSSDYNHLLRTIMQHTER
jgi:hypothetical protein